MDDHNYHSSSCFALPNVPMIVYLNIGNLIFYEGIALHTFLVLIMNIK